MPMPEMQKENTFIDTISITTIKINKFLLQVSRYCTQFSQNQLLNVKKSLEKKASEAIKMKYIHIKNGP